MIIAVAPLQGYTEAPFRHFHREVYGPVAHVYFSPFVRIEHGEVRKRDVRDITSSLNMNHHVVPQIIFKNVDEFRRLLDEVVSAGYDHVDLNMGCPFRPQTRQGRGSGMLVNGEELERVRVAMEGYGNVSFSVKMRLGLDDEADWRRVVPVINAMDLVHVTVHPRTAADEYKGDLRLAEFDRLLPELEHPVIYNGDVRMPGDMEALMERYPSVAGVMIGRGLLARPSIINEWQEGREWSADERLGHLLCLHDGIYGYYRSALCGDAQVLSKIKPFWEYVAPSLDRKAVKAIKKATTLSRYETAVASLTCP